MASIEGKGPNGAQIVFPEWVGSDTTGAALRIQQRSEQERRKAALSRLRHEWEAQDTSTASIQGSTETEGEAE